MTRALRITVIATGTIIVVLAAIAQVAGRAVVALAPALEDTVNGVLADMDVEVEGLRGRWQGFGPGFAADRLRATWGELEDVEFDLDLTESLGRNRVVARRLKVGNGVVALERGDEGWRLKGATGSMPYDITALALHSDALNAEFEVVLHDAGQVGALGRLTLRLANEADRHRFSVRIRPPDGCPAANSCSMATSAPAAADTRGSRPRSSCPVRPWQRCSVSRTPNSTASAPCAGTPMAHAPN